MTTTAKDFLTDWAQAVFGPDHYKKDASRYLGVNETTFHRWVTGRTDVDWDHPVVQRALDSLRRLQPVAETYRDHL